MIHLLCLNTISRNLKGSRRIKNVQLGKNRRSSWMRSGIIEFSEVLYYAVNGESCTIPSCSLLGNPKWRKTKDNVQQLDRFLGRQQCPAIT